MFRKPTAWPSWLLSLVFHVALIVIVGLSLRIGTRQGAAVERTADVGIVLKHQEGGQDYYESPDDGNETQAAAADSAASVAEGIVSDRPPSDASADLPQSLNIIGPGALEGGSVPSAVGAQIGPSGVGRSLGGKARTSVFGIEGEGYRFVYLFDRSASMTGARLAAAKQQLKASLDSLGKTHQFHIIFYNDRILQFNPTGIANKLFFANDQNKNRARKFVDNVTATGATQNKDALLFAIGLQPDVIFFLTDAEEHTKLRPGDLELIRRRATGITINAIEFGNGPQANRNNFLEQLARENGGRHGYVDASSLGRR